MAFELSEGLIVQLARKWKRRLFDLENFAKLHSIPWESVLNSKTPSSDSKEAFAQALVTKLQHNPEAFLSYLEEVGFEKDLELVEELNNELQNQGLRISLTQGDWKISRTPKSSKRSASNKATAEPYRNEIASQKQINDVEVQDSSDDSNLEREQQNRDRFLRVIYRIYQTSGPNAIGNMWEIGKELGLDQLSTNKVTQWLADHFYISFEAMGGGIKITTRGIDLIEQSLSKAQQIERRDTSGSEKPSPTRIFIVHGHDVASKEELARILREMGLEPVILHERPEKGRVLIEKLEDHSSDVGYAFVLLTPDDVGSPNVEPFNLKPRARQNVVFEFGYLMGKLGRDRICCLYTGEVEIPSDIQGIVYIPFGKSIDEVYKKILDELRAARYNPKV